MPTFGPDYVWAAAARRYIDYHLPVDEAWPGAPVECGRSTRSPASIWMKESEAILLRCRCCLRCTRAALQRALARRNDAHTD
jgi:hypothetical protein